MLLAVTSFVAVWLASGHVAMNRPGNWLDPDGKKVMGPEWGMAGCKAGNQCITSWYSNGTTIPGEPTIPRDSPLRTFQDSFRGSDVGDFSRTHPWRAPGTAPIGSPCGTDGGNPEGCPPGNPSQGGCEPGGYGHGPDARSLPGNTAPTQWKAGDAVEVGFGFFANHGGGYYYRLCPMPADGRTALTEECFQKNPLSFVGDTQWVEYLDNNTRVAFPAMRTTSGTFPAGSQWTRNPVPACMTTIPGTEQPNPGSPSTGGGARNHCAEPQFPPPAPNLWGFFGLPMGRAITGIDRTLPAISIVDKVRVPSTLMPGDYVLSFRYDAEQTTQVWNSCTDVRVSAPPDTIV